MTALTFDLGRHSVGLGGVTTFEIDDSGSRPDSYAAIFMPGLRPAHVSLWREGEEYNTRKGNNSAQNLSVVSLLGCQPLATSESVTSLAVGAHERHRQGFAMTVPDPGAPARVISRRTVMTAALGAVPASLLPAAPHSDPDALFLAAWSRVVDLDDLIDAVGDDDDLVDALAAEQARHCEFIASAPCRGVHGVTVKLRLLDWLWRGGSEADWELPLVRMSILTLESLS